MFYWYIITIKQTLIGILTDIKHIVVALHARPFLSPFKCPRFPHQTNVILKRSVFITEQMFERSIEIMFSFWSEIYVGRSLM